MYQFIKTKYRPQDPATLANYIVKHANGITNMHLQQVMLIMQGYFLNQYHCRLIKGNFIRHPFGPIMPEVYNYYKQVLHFDDGKNIIEPVIKHYHSIYGRYFSKPLMLNTKVLPNYGDFKQLVLNLIKTPEDKLVDLICSQPFWKRNTMNNSPTASTYKLTLNDSVTCYLAYKNSKLK